MIQTLRFRKLRLAIEWCWTVNPYRYIGYKHDYYDGDFWCFGFWWFHIFITNNPRIYLTNKELEEVFKRLDETR